MLDREVEHIPVDIAAVCVVGGVVAVDVTVDRADGLVEAHLQLRKDVPVAQRHVVARQKYREGMKGHRKRKQ